MCHPEVAKLWNLKKQILSLSWKYITKANIKYLWQQVMAKIILKDSKRYGCKMENWILYTILVKLYKFFTKIAQNCQKSLFSKKSDFLKLSKNLQYNGSNSKITGTKNLVNTCKNKIDLIFFFFSNTELEHFEKTEKPPKSPFFAVFRKSWQKSRKLPKNAIFQKKRFFETLKKSAIQWLK